MSIVLKYILKIIGILFFGALGALFFNVFVLPYLLTDPYFERFRFVKDFKAGKIIINPKESVYIQENAFIEDVILRVQKSIVVIQSAKLGLKSGLIATSDGLIVTLASAIPADSNFSVFVAGESVSFKVLKTDSKNNLFMIKIEKNNLPTVAFTDYNKLKLGQKVFFTYSGSSKQDSWLANEGIIRQISQDGVKTNILENKIPSGTPLFDSSGELVGLGFIDSEGRVSAITINKIKELLGF